MLCGFRAGMARRLPETQIHLQRWKSLRFRRRFTPKILFERRGRFRRPPGALYGTNRLNTEAGPKEVRIVSEAPCARKIQEVCASGRMRPISLGFWGLVASNTWNPKVMLLSALEVRACTRLRRGGMKVRTSRSAVPLRQR